MLYFIADHFRDWLEAHKWLRFLRVFRFVTFETTLAIVFGFFFCIVLGPRMIGWLRRKKIGDLPSFDQAEIDKLMEGKKGVPTMGGLFIICSITATVVLLGNLRDFYVQMGLLCLIWLGGVGAADDWLKLTTGRRTNSRQGLNSKEKLLFQIGLGVLLSYFTWKYGSNEQKLLYFPFFKSLHVGLNLGCFILISTLVITGSSNAVNLTDGLDGLAAGNMAIVSFTFCILSLIIGNRASSTELLLPYVQATDQMAVLAGAMAGACVGFLWFNCSPASVFMGDTGSLAMGGLIGYIAIVVRQELLLFLIGGIFVVEAVSVMIQVSCFKFTRI